MSMEVPPLTGGVSSENCIVASPIQVPLERANILWKSPGTGNFTVAVSIGTGFLSFTLVEEPELMVEAGFSFFSLLQANSRIAVVQIAKVICFIICGLELF